LKHDWEELFVLRGDDPREPEYIYAGLDYCSRCKALRRVAPSEFYYKPSSWAYNTTEEPKCVPDCDELCIRYVRKECITMRKDDICDEPDMYREVGDVIDALNDAALFKEGVGPV